MTPDWLTNPDAVAHIKRLLVQTGAPLESRVARICADADLWCHHHTIENQLIARGRLLYGNTLADMPLREIDQGITLQSFLDVAEDDAIGTMSLELHILIECKHRDGLAVFGFPYQFRSGQSATNPILCEFAFAPFIQSIDQEVPFLQHEPLCTIGLLDNMQKTPRVSDEHLIYKAGASLYDFIRFQSQPLVEPYLDPTIQKMGLLDHLTEVVKESAFDPWNAARRWMRSHLTEDQYTDFYVQAGGILGSFVPTIAVFVPIVCVDAPLYVSDIDDQGDIQSIISKDYLLSSVRVPKWPSIFHQYLAHRTPEALVTIVNVTYLRTFLEQIAAWFSILGVYLQNIDEPALRKAYVEQKVLQSVMSMTEHRGYYEDVWRI